MVGDYVRDKDAVSACMLICEMVMRYSKLGITLEEVIENLYRKLGYYKENTINLVMEGLDGMRAMADLMNRLRTSPLSEIAGTDVLNVSDYSTGVKTDATSGEQSKMELSGSNVLRYELSDDTVIIVRPSGTEPKIKVYILAKGDSMDDCISKTKKYTDWAEKLK